MIINFKKLHENAVIPTKAHKWDAAFDLTATSRRYDNEYGFYEYGTGLSFEVSRGFAAIIFPRSSISKYDLVLANSIPLIDSPYRGEVKLRFKEIVPSQMILEAAYSGVRAEFVPKIYEVGDRIGQIMIIPVLGIEFQEVESLDKTDREAGSFGSSGV